MFMQNIQDAAIWNAHFCGYLQAFSRRSPVTSFSTAWQQLSVISFLTLKIWLLHNIQI